MIAADRLHATRVAEQAARDRAELVALRARCGKHELEHERRRPGAGRPGGRGAATAGDRGPVAWVSGVAVVGAAAGEAVGQSSGYQWGLLRSGCTVLVAVLDGSVLIDPRRSPICTRPVLIAC